MQGPSKDVSREKMPDASKDPNLIEGVQHSLQTMWGNSAIASWMRELNGSDINREGTLSSPSDRSKGTWVQEGPHLMILLPASMMKDFPRDPYAGGPYVMFDGSEYVHMMVPLTTLERPE